MDSLDKAYPFLAEFKKDGPDVLPIAADYAADKMNNPPLGELLRVLHMVHSIQQRVERLLKKKYTLHSYERRLFDGDKYTEIFVNIADTPCSISTAHNRWVTVGKWVNSFPIASIAFPLQENVLDHQRPAILGRLNGSIPLGSLRTNGSTSDDALHLHPARYIAEYERSGPVDLELGIAYYRVEDKHAHERTIPLFAPTIIERCWEFLASMLPLEKKVAIPPTGHVPIHCASKALQEFVHELSLVIQ